ncbi:hypothetical protein CDD81_5669 [Ophiocordyceps australis]|uniref:LAA1-like C-terminal TPR repeats domain-containing protein n=1 Tax=Ophiocordyceps australis TaxID=1399860 RepID=A0A2C5Y4E8_9HYPO|nr:hypothetical protein CDD81_5669 [Ophiocordyceps australis]
MSPDAEPEASGEASVSQPVAAAADSTVEARIVTPELDLAKLQSLPPEQQDLFLFTFVSDLSNHVLALSADDCTAQQFYLKRQIFQIINLASPPPSRVIRNNLGKCLAHVFGKGDRKLLFETINDLVSIVSGSRSKSDGETRAKHAAVSCLGHVYWAAGDSAIALHQLVCTTLLKTLKGSSNNAGLRAAALTALAKIVSAVKASMDEGISRDIWRQGRMHASGDKGALVIVAACQCLEALAKQTPYFNNSVDLDKLETALIKAFDSPSAAARHAAAECFAEALMQGYIGSASINAHEAITKAKKPKGKLKRASTHPSVAVDEDELPPRSESPAPSGKRTQALALTLADMLKTLSTQYVKASASNRVRAAIGVCYGKLFQLLGEKRIQAGYLEIIESLTVDVLGHATISNNRYRLLISRRIVNTVLQEVIGRKILGESGQMAMAELLMSNVIKNYPQALAERAEPSKHTLIVSLSAMAMLLESLGSAANVFAESCRDGLLQVLQHPSYSVQVFASHCIKTLVLCCPQQLLPCLSVCMNSLSRELSLLGGARTSPRKCLGFGHGLAASLSASPLRPLYGSVDINSRVLTMATNLLKSSGSSELRVSSTQIQVAWILIGGLMALGPNFVKIHLSQLLLLWKNALPKPLAKDNSATRSLLETCFLTHVRECALGSILAFLQFNSRLLTVDVSKRIAAMLQSTTAFLRTLPSKKSTEEVSQRLTPALQLQDIEVMVQRRVLQCYIKLVNTSPAGGSEALLQSNLLTLTISLFADPENYTPSSLSASIANSAATFETIWEVGDNSGYGITGLVKGFQVRRLPGQHDKASEEEGQQGCGWDEEIDKLLQSPICGSLEHDAAMVYIGGAEEWACGVADPPATEVINKAIQLFAFTFPLTPAKVQESILEQVKTFGSAGTLQRDLGRKAAIKVNVATALEACLRVAGRETQSAAGEVGSAAVERLLQDLVRDSVLDGDEYVRSLGYSTVARLCNVYGNDFTKQEIKYLVETIVANREPSARAGCAMALGWIQTKVGGMAAGYHVKTIVGILMSLCHDPHPTVHYWALEALSLASDAAGLSFASHVSSTLGMLAQVYVSETHHGEVASAVTMNLESEVSTTAAIVKCVDSLINVLGPDLQEGVKSRELVLRLVDEFSGESEGVVQRAALGCQEHLSLYAPGQMRFGAYVKLLQRHVSGEDVRLRHVAVDGLYNLMKRDARQVLDEADEGLERQLWLVLDSEPGHEGLRNIVGSWLQQTGLEHMEAWLQRMQAVLRMTRRAAPESSRAAKALPDVEDDEVAGFAGGAAKDKEAEALGWQVRMFAMECVLDMLAMAAHQAARGESTALQQVQGRVADIVGMAFSASTSSVLELRLAGLKMIGALLKMFGRTPDADFDEAMLLEQYQAQITSALTPAFAADSSPELASEAVSVCASFMSIGIVTDVDRMGRILKTLVNALDAFSAPHHDAAIGDLAGLSANATVMVKISVFSAWADLQVASTEHAYLVHVVQPHIAKLTPLWLESLREFARLRFEPDISMTLGPPSLAASLDSIYAALNRETLLRFYQDSWLRLVDAIASLIEHGADFVFDALDGKEPTPNATTKPASINYRHEPVAFFFVLFGLAFEALATRPGHSQSLAAQGQTLEILDALKRILHPTISGQAIYRPDVFGETMDLLDRLVLTEGLPVQAVIVQIARALCVAHPSAQRHSSTDGDLSDDIDQLFELTRIIVLVLTGLLPNLAHPNQPVRHDINSEAVMLVATALNALVDAAQVFPSIIKTDLHACIMHIFATILAAPACQHQIVPQSLPTLKRFVATMDGSMQLQACLRRFLAIYAHAQKRQEPSSLPCVKNCLLATTILFASANNELPATHPLVSRFLDELLDCLTDRMTAKIAASCIRSLLLLPHPTPADSSISRYLIPRIIAFTTSTSIDDPEHARSQLAHTLCLFVASLQSPHQKSAAMALVVPALLAQATAHGPDSYAHLSDRLLELAALDQHVFKAIVAAMTHSQRSLLQDVIRLGRQATGLLDKSHAGTASEQPTITLKMDFGG